MYTLNQFDIYTNKYVQYMTQKGEWQFCKPAWNSLTLALGHLAIFTVKLNSPKMVLKKQV